MKIRNTQLNFFSNDLSESKTYVEISEYDLQKNHLNENQHSISMHQLHLDFGDIQSFAFNPNRAGDLELNGWVLDEKSKEPKTKAITLEATVEKLSEQNWEEIIPRVQAYSILKASRLKWRRGTAVLPKGLEPKDLATEAIAKLYQGERKWDYEKHPDLVKHLMNIVDSLVSNLVESYEHQCSMSTSDLVGESLAVSSSMSCPDYENEFEAEDMLIKIYECAKGDENLELIFDCLTEGMKPREIAEEHGIDRDEVYQLIRKLQRRAAAAGLKR